MVLAMKTASPNASLALGPIAKMTKMLSLWVKLRNSAISGETLAIATAVFLALRWAMAVTSPDTNLNQWLLPTLTLSVLGWTSTFLSGLCIHQRTGMTVMKRQGDGRTSRHKAWRLRPSRRPWTNVTYLTWGPKWGPPDPKYGDFRPFSLHSNPVNSCECFSFSHSSILWNKHYWWIPKGWPWVGTRMHWLHNLIILKGTA